MIDVFMKKGLKSTIKLINMPYRKEKDMKKMTALFFITIMFVFLWTSSAMAAEATVIKDFGCQIIPADSGLPVMLTTTDKTQAVESGSGNVNFTCHFKFDPKAYPLEKNMKHEGFVCGTQFGMTQETSAVTTPGGQVTLKCKIKQKQK